MVVKHQQRGLFSDLRCRSVSFYKSSKMRRAGGLYFSLFYANIKALIWFYEAEAKNFPLFASFDDQLLQTYNNQAVNRKAILVQMVIFLYTLCTHTKLK